MQHIAVATDDVEIPDPARSASSRMLDGLTGWMGMRSTGATEPEPEPYSEQD